MPSDEPTDGRVAEGNCEVACNFWRCTKCGRKVMTNDGKIGFCIDGHTIDLRKIKDFQGIPWEKTPKTSELKTDKSVKLCSDHSSDELWEDNGKVIAKKLEFKQCHTPKVKKVTRKEKSQSSDVNKALFVDAAKINATLTKSKEKVVPRAIE